MTFETFDESDKKTWHEQKIHIFGNISNFGKKNSYFQKKSDFWNNFIFFGKNSYFRKHLIFWENKLIFWENNSYFRKKNSYFLENFILDRVNCTDSASFILKHVSLRNGKFVMLFSLFQKKKANYQNTKQRFLKAECANKIISFP